MIREIKEMFLDIFLPMFLVMVFVVTTISIIICSVMWFNYYLDNTLYPKKNKSCSSHELIIKETNHATKKR